ncbi:MAG: hypothetical protein SF182_04115 [Deltaproteobacteria bacterium]|nr:hypothetical protein [Deltaproteobacteria bacterium]
MRVWRVVAGVPQWLFTYAGAIDDAVLRAVMQHVRRLTSAVPGEWNVEVVGVGLEGGLLHAVRSDLTDLRRSGLRPYLGHARRPRALRRALLARRAQSSPSTSTLLH